MRVKTRSGTVYYYDWTTNEIELTDCEEVALDRQFTINSENRFHSFPMLDTYVLEITNKCNLRCTYCCYSGEYRNTRSHGNLSMTVSTIDEIHEFIRLSNTQPSIWLGFYGGECLLEYDLIKYCVVQAKRRFDKELRFFLSTNGVLLDAEKIDWFVSNGFLLNISLDGTQSYNDKNRRNAFGTGSFGSVYKHLEYIKTRYPDYFESSVNILMTLPKMVDLLPIAKEWHDDVLLSFKAPAHISNLAPNYQKGVGKVDEEEVTTQLYGILDAFIAHPEYEVLRAFLNERTNDWLERAIYDLPEHNQLATCMPNNKKLFVDVFGKIGVCEKMCDLYRIGDISNGIDWVVANDYVEKLVEMRKTRCVNCPIIRMCDICLTSLDLSKEELDVFCHNQKVYTKAFLLLFCEMAELGLIDKK